MPRIVAVHGIGQQFKGEYELLAEWLPPLRDGVKRVSEIPVGEIDVACAFYGDLFRRKGMKTLGDPPYDATDVIGDWEKGVLESWWSDPQAWESDCGTYEKTTESRARAERWEHPGDRLRDRRFPAPPC